VVGAAWAAGLRGVVTPARPAGPEPTAQLEALFLRLYENLTVRAPDDTLLLMRELLDNRFRAEHAHSWPMRSFLDSLVAMVRAAPATRGLSDSQALARVYMLIGAMNYVAVSEPTLRNMYGKAAYAELRAQLPGQVRSLVRAALGAA
jgi:hypothetical protein